MSAEMLETTLAALVLFVGAFIQGFFGFGFGIISMGVLTFTHGLMHAAGVVNIEGILLTASLGFRLRKKILWRVAARIAPALAVGVLIGITSLRALDRDFMVTALGVVIVAISLWNLVSPSLEARESALWDGAAGLASGLLGGAFNTGGPPLIVHLYRRHEHPEALKATLQALFLGVGLTRLPSAAAQGLLSGEIWRDAALAAPVVLIGLSLGVRLAGRTDPERFRRSCWVALGVLGVLLLIIG